MLFTGVELCCGRKNPSFELLLSLCGQASTSSVALFHQLTSPVSVSSAQFDVVECCGDGHGICSMTSERLSMQE